MSVVLPNDSYSGSFKPNPGQAIAVSGVKRFIHSDDRYACIVGAPGTGKTATVGEIIKELRSSCLSLSHPPAILYCAPTHAAVRVGKDALLKHGIGNINACTIQSFCGLRQQTAADGKQTFYKQPNHISPQAANRYLKLLIIDEASMIGRELLEHILDTIGRRNIKLLFIGDTGQLPPVGEDESAALTLNNARTFELTEVVRHGGPILDLAIETGNLMLGRPELTICDDGPIVVTNSQIKWNRMFQAALADTGKDTLGLVQAYAYRNDEVARLNSMARRQLYGNEVSRIVEGEMLISTGTINEGGTSGFEGMQCPSTTRMRVTDVELATVYAARNFWLKVYQVEAYSPDMDASLHFSVVHDADRQAFKQRLNALAEDITKQPSKVAKKRWATEFYPLKSWDAPVTSACATTVHRAQGATVERVFLQVDDIDRARRDPRLWNRLFYTGLTRASKQVIIRNLSARNA